MAGTFSQIYIQVVFAVKGRQNLIQKEWKDGLHRYIAGINHKTTPMKEVNGNSLYKNSTPTERGNLLLKAFTVLFIICIFSGTISF